MNLKEKTNLTKLSRRTTASRENINSGSANSSMRKYQQLALAIVSIVSLLAFLFYKHEYDRLRYTLEYLEMFGSAPTDISSNALCGSTMLRKLNTVPHSWTMLSTDIAVYSSFWDEGNGLTRPILRTIAVLKKSNMPPVELSAHLVFETEPYSLDGVCSIESISVNKEDKKSPMLDEELKLIHILCRAESYEKSIPYLTQFKIGTKLSSPVFVQVSESWKSVSNISCLCVYSLYSSLTSVRLIEYISFYRVLGVEKFVFYGNILTPLVRKLLDKYGDESNVFYEEKSFILPQGFTLKDRETRKIIETDCLYRHRDNYENVFVMKINEFLIPRNKNSLQDILTAVGGRSTAAISEFGLVSQNVCLDEAHSEKSHLLLSSQLRIHDSKAELGISIYRPHLMDSILNVRTSRGTGVQRVPFSIASVYSFFRCNSNTHAEEDHLPFISKFVDLIERSLLYRKWKIS